MKLPLEGSPTILSFFPDDTIETVRQHVALAKKTHPDRLFIQVQLELPKDYYSSNPKRWMDLFFRMSYGKNIIKKEILDAYVSYVRVGTGVSARDITLEDWKSVEEFLIPLFDPPSDFKEWRILGVAEDKSVILPIPVKEVNLPEAFRPVPSRQVLFDSIHREEAIAIRAEDLDSESDIIRQVYFPFFQSSTPANIENLRIPLKTASDQLQSLLDLKAPKPTHTAILRAKWYIPLISTKFTAPRTRFEQIFYGLTVSPETPVISFFTSRSETTRHKFYVQDPKRKEPLLDISMWKAWTTNTQPQRRLPTLLLYRGKSRISFDRIAITSKDITVSTWRSKDSKDTLEDLQTSTLEWIKSLDAVMPFLVETDLDLSRWTLNDMTTIVSYGKEISEFDMRRFGCLQNVFGFQDNTFRLLRADHPSDIPSEVLRAYAILQTGERLETELGVSPEEAASLTEKVKALEEDENFNFEKATSGYPAISFSSKDVMIKFVTNLDRVLKYASILRYVLTSDSNEVNEVCPRRLETVEASVGVASQTIEIEDEFDMSAFADDIEEVAAKPEEISNTESTPASCKVMKVIKGGPQGTLGYFNNRILKIDPDLIDNEYTKKCEKLTQVVVLTKADQARIPPEYNYSRAPENEKMKVDKGIAVCPQYWCMKDEIPLAEDQLVVDEDGKHCPMCNGKVRVTDKEDAREFTVIKRKTEYKYPDYKEPSEKSSCKKKVPCCYRRPGNKNLPLSPSEPTDESPSAPTDDYYVLASGKIPALRIAYLPETLARRMSVKTNYLKTCPKNRIEASASDMFRVGMGLPRDTLPTLLNIERSIPAPADAKDQTIQCSFFRTWKDLGEGDTPIDRIVDGIDRAYKQKTLPIMDEIEYVTVILDCRVMKVNTATNTMSCGFWTDKTSPRSRTIVLLDTDILSRVTRRKGNVGSKFVYAVDIKQFEEEAKNTLQSLHTAACTTSLPTFKDAENELLSKNMADYEVILDPFKRVQAIFVPQEVVLPIQPSSIEIPMGVRSRSGYADIQDQELPSSKTLAQFLDGTKHPGFKKVKVLHGANGFYSEFILESGFRALFRPEEAKEKDTVEEVLQTVRDPHSESELVHAEPNKADLKLASEISYSSEVFEFLMFSLSKDIQTEEYETLRNAIKNPGPDLMKQLKTWLDSETYWDSVNEPVQFVNKVRTPCGQMEKDSCKKSTLCGWHQNTCKIKVKPIVNERQILVRLAKTLKENTKQRALVLDERLSPFFSTILYLEMPHELITTNP
jgi:hypothetical protein